MSFRTVISLPIVAAGITLGGLGAAGYAAANPAQPNCPVEQGTVCSGGNNNAGNPVGNSNSVQGNGFQATAPGQVGPNAVGNSSGAIGGGGFQYSR